jgi:hypothetical protein
LTDLERRSSKGFFSAEPGTPQKLRIYLDKLSVTEPTHGHEIRHCIEQLANHRFASAQTRFGGFGGFFGLEQFLLGRLRFAAGLLGLFQIMQRLRARTLQLANTQVYLVFDPRIDGLQAGVAFGQPHHFLEALQN